MMLAANVSIDPSGNSTSYCRVSRIGFEFRRPRGTPSPSRWRRSTRALTPYGSPHSLFHFMNACFGKVLPWAIRHRGLLCDPILSTDIACSPHHFFRGVVGYEYLWYTNVVDEVHDCFMVVTFSFPGVNAIITKSVGINCPPNMSMY